MNFVPRAILVYHEKRITAQQNQINRRLATASPQESVELMTRLSRLNAMKKTINVKLGRIKK